VLQNKASAVRCADISDFLKIKKQSVRDAIRLLKNKGLVNQEKFGDICLTPKGKTEANEVLKRHKLIKRFLELTLGLDKKNSR